MPEVFVLEPVPAGEGGRRVPDSLPISAPERDTLENVLRAAGYVIASVDMVTVPSARTAGADARRLRAGVAAVVNEADDSERAVLEAAVSARPDDGLDERFWGPGPDSEAAAKAAFADLSDQFAQRQQLLVNSISRDETAALLGVTAQSITTRLAARKLVGIKMGREWRLPTWQFDPDDPTGVLPDLHALQAAFPGGPVSLSRWMLRAQPEFDGRSAREELLLRGSGAVIEVARVLTSAGW